MLDMVCRRCVGPNREMRRFGTVPLLYKNAGHEEDIGLLIRLAEGAKARQTNTYTLVWFRIIY